MHEYVNKKKYLKIFTVAQTLKDSFILNHIKPDYGSLEDFIGDINIGRDLLNNQKKYMFFNFKEKELRQWRIELGEED